VNLIGEHTDYNLGFVLPAAIDREIWLAFEEWDRPGVELTSAEMNDTKAFDFDNLMPKRRSETTWIDYVAGTAWAMKEAGLPMRGFRGVLDSTVPFGSGLSSSAALEMASLLALLGPSEALPAAAVRARIGQRGENAYVGVNCGIMDQYASAAGRANNALLIDCRSNEATATPMPAGISLVVCDTSAPRQLGIDYNKRREECELGVKLIAETEPGVKSLRDVDATMLARHIDRMPELIGHRCEHVVSENRRVMDTVVALREGDLAALGRLFAASHNSLRDAFEVSCPELDLMVEIAGTVPGVVASRMTGGGFGGCTVNLVAHGAEDALRETVMRDYTARTGLSPKVYAVAAVDGAGQLSRP
jgi:galactokinase